MDSSDRVPLGYQGASTLVTLMFGQSVQALRKCNANLRKVQSLYLQEIIAVSKQGIQLSLGVRLPVCLTLASGQGIFRNGTCVVIYLIFLSSPLSLYVPLPAITWVSNFQQQTAQTRKEASKDEQKFQVSYKL